MTMGTVFARPWRSMARAAAATTFLAATLAVGLSQEAAAQSDECRRMVEACQADCAQKCAEGDAACIAECRRGACLEVYANCVAPETEAAPSPRAAPRMQAPSAPSSARPRTGATRERSLHSMEPASAADAAPGAELEGRVLFLASRQSEPEAEYYGYLLIGENVSETRKSAVAAAIACRLEALPDAEAAAAVERLGLFSLPALRQAGATRVTAEQVLSAYDFERAARWLRAAGYATGESFHRNSAIVFVGSTLPRARQMDSVALPGAREGLDPVVADASGLSANFAAAWVGRIIDGLEAGEVRSRQDLQGWMEATSWLDWAGQPILNLFRVNEAQASNAPDACPTSASPG